jgi:aryl-alcohol dehydrogenase-like predicted oxidoreductase
MTSSSTLDMRPLGSTGIEVSVVGLGGNTFGPPRLDEAQTKRVIDAAFDLGVNFVDTALVYGQGLSEEFLGRCLGARRGDMIVATKFNFRVAGEGTPGERIVAQAETSLRKLATDYIDLYQIHTPDPSVPAEEILGALDSLVKAGKVRAIGACNYASWRMAEAAHVAQVNGLTAFGTLQNYYHLLAREIESEIVPWCRGNSVGILPYHPLGGGFLTGKYREGQPPPAGTRGAAGSGIIDHMATPANYDKLRQLEAFCASAGHTVAELAIAWLLVEPAVSSVIAGVSTPQQLASNVAAASWHLTDEEKHAVDHIVSGPSGRPANPELPPYA